MYLCTYILSRLELETPKAVTQNSRRTLANQCPSPRVVNDKSLCNNYCLHKQPTQKKHVTPHQNHSYEEIRAIIDTETNVTSKSALSVFKSKIATKTWTYICPPRSNELEQKGNS